MIDVTGNSGSQVMTLFDAAQNPRIQIDSSVGVYILDTSGNARVQFDAFGTSLNYGTKRIGVDATGAYKSSGVTKTYL